MIDALFAVPSVASESGRQLLVDRLPPEIALNVPHSAGARVHHMGIVQTCVGYDGGLALPLSAVRTLERDSLAMRRLDATVAELSARLRP